MIVSDINGCNEIVKEGINGLIIPVKNTEALQTAIEKIITDENFRKKLSASSREMIIKNYSRENLWNELLDEYKNLLHAKTLNFTHV